MSQKEKLTIRPYARLLTMLGDQLIKDEMIALIELVKNAYDADSERVKISFNCFNKDFSINDKSTIVIEDEGNGMNDIILKEAWMNPATPEKLKRKRLNNTTDKGRIIQGEKGIGRFAIFKLGRTIKVITRRQKQSHGHFVNEPESNTEYVLSYDFSDYDIDFLKEGVIEKDIYLDDLSVGFESREAEEIIPSNMIYSGSIIVRRPYGTKIVISNLKGEWDKNKITKVYQSIIRLQPIFGKEFVQDFSVYVEVNGEAFIPTDKSVDEIQTILDNKSVFIVEGDFNTDKSTISYTLDNHNRIDNYEFELSDPEMQGISPMKEFFSSIKHRKIECGDFAFKFYIFDLNITTKDPDTRYYLDIDEKKSIKAHRVYLYRDGIRVMPYGDPEDDWLKLDTIRGIESAGHVFGNDQVVGYITISQEKNPKLRDKTNREGLIEDGYAREDLVSICQLILRYIRTKDFARYLIDKKNKKMKRDEALQKPISLISKAREENTAKTVVDEVLKNIGSISIKEIPEDNLIAGQKVVNQFLDSFEESYLKQVNVFETRIFTTESLAAIGLSAETAYHDARIILHEVNNSLSAIINNYKKQSSDFLDRRSVIKDLTPIKTQITTVYKLMNNIQRLFPSTKSKKKAVNVNQVITMVKKLYSKSMNGAEIDCTIRNTSNQLLVVECTDAVLLQVFINLFDNALYWLKTVGINRQILIEVNAEQKTVIFSDSGPGVSPDDAPYIFEAFYTGKGMEGKGLGLYIARQLLERYNCSIELINDDKSKLLNGANFILKFTNEEA